MKSRNYPNINHPIVVKFDGHNRIVIMNEDESVEIAEIFVETMEQDVNLGDGWKIEPSENFFLVFRKIDKDLEMLDHGTVCVVK